MALSGRQGRAHPASEAVSAMGWGAVAPLAGRAPAGMARPEAEAGRAARGRGRAGEGSAGCDHGRSYRRPGPLALHLLQGAPANCAGQRRAARRCARPGSRRGWWPRRSGAWGAQRSPWLSGASWSLGSLETCDDLGPTSRFPRRAMPDGGAGAIRTGGMIGFAVPAIARTALRRRRRRPCVARRAVRPLVAPGNTRRRCAPWPARNSACLRHRIDLAAQRASRHHGQCPSDKAISPARLQRTRV